MRGGDTCSYECITTANSLALKRVASMLVQYSGLSFSAYMSAM